MEESVYPKQKIIEGDIALDESWKVAPVPERGSDERFGMGQGYDVRVTVSGSKITGKAFDSDDRLFNYSRELRVPGGRIVGYDHGEFGGKISFISNRGNESPLVDENFKGFYIVDDRLFALSGMDHFFTDKGHIYEMVYSEEKWEAVLMLDLFSCPQSYLLVDKTLYIATNKALMVVENCEIKESMTIEVSWSGLFPNSIVQANASLYIGMRGGMVSVGLEDKKITWYCLASK